MSVCCCSDMCPRKHFFRHYKYACQKKKRIHTPTHVRPQEFARIRMCAFAAHAILPPPPPPSLGPRPWGRRSTRSGGPSRRRCGRRRRRRSGSATGGSWSASWPTSRRRGSWAWAAPPARRGVALAGRRGACCGFKPNLITSGTSSGQLPFPVSL